MNRTLITSLALGGLMLLSAGLSKVMTPTHHMSDSRGGRTLESVIPVAFGGWSEEKSANSQIVNPETEAFMNKIYSQVVSRTYVNAKGDRVMLSVAYGTDQKKGYEVHYPEICYPAQGFQVTSNVRDVIQTGQGAIAVNRLETNLTKQRYEPLTYWSTTGDDLTTGGLSRKLKEVSIGLKGEIPDGMVFRVSTIDQDTKNAFAVQDAFVKSLAAVLAPRDKTWLMGLH